ncbi:cell division protein ZipA [Rodentibacter pneumotropicus]|nr:cell division protein ZipA [Rodentibacter pneumotropicus]
MYHRHFDLSVASPTLFSVANLQDDGSFNPYNTEFSTIGIVLFMKLPSPGSDLANLKLMIRAAKTLAEDLGGTVLTEDEKIFDDYQEQRYLERV